MLTVSLFTRILVEFAPKSLLHTAELCGTLCAAVLLFPSVLELLGQTADTTRVLGGFLVAAVPVYTGILLLSGSTAAGTTYGALTLAAANGITALSGQLFVALLRAFLALTTVSSATAHGLERFTEKLYKCVKWVLTLTVSVFTGILSLQTLLSARADAVTGKAVKMIASSAVPIIGGAFSDALAVLSAGVGTVKSGAGAFGMLAALLILLPLGIRICIWIMICEVSSFAAEIFSLRSIGSFLSGCSTALKMLLALLFSAGMAAVISAAVLLCVRGGYG
jgi:stage III sporulation protein AE